MSDVIYFVQRESDEAVKIGTSKRLKTRLVTLAKKYGNLKLLGVISGGPVRERVLHWCLASDRLDGEFFRPTQELLDVIDKYAYIPDGVTTSITITRSGGGVVENQNKKGIRLNPQPIIDRFGRASQEEIAEAVGVTRITVSAWLNGRLKAIELDTLEKFADACEVSPSEFLVMVE